MYLIIILMFIEFSIGSSVTSHGSCGISRFTPSPKPRNMYVRPPFSPRQGLLLLFTAFAVFSVPRSFGDTLFVVNKGSGTSNGSIAEYTVSGSTVTTVNASLVKGLSQPMSLAVSGSDLFVLNTGTGTIDEYTTTGAVVETSLVTGLSGARGIAVSGSALFVTDAVNGRIEEFNTSGSLLKANFITGLGTPEDIAISGSDLFVTDWTNDCVAMYTTGGALLNADLVSPDDLANPVGVTLTVSGSDLFVTSVNYPYSVGEFQVSYTTDTVSVLNADLITGLSNPWGVAVSGSDLFVSNTSAGTIGEYTTSGTKVNSSVIKSLGSPMELVVVPSAASVPDQPSTALLLGACLAALFLAASLPRHSPRQVTSGL